MRGHVLLYKRFLDDIFIIWSGSEEQFKDFMSKLNTFHHCIKFTSSCDFKEKRTNFLDVTIEFQQGSISTDLFIKETSVNQYLLPSSCHPVHCHENIPFSLGFRIKRICSEDATFQRRLEQLREMLLAREYRPRVIEAAFNKLKDLDRSETLRKVENKSSEKLTLVMTYDPRFPKMSAVVQKHFKTLVMDPEMKQVFQDKGMQVAYKRHRNIREFLCRAKLYDLKDRRNPTRATQLGWRKCNKCTTCRHSENKNGFLISATKERVPI